MSILVTTDLSAPARHAVHRAAGLAAEHAARLTLMHVISGSLYEELCRWLGSARVPDDMTQRSRQQLEQMASELRAAHGITVDTLVTSGHVIEDVSTQVRRLQADLLVVGARGEGFMHHPGIGSTAHRLMQRTECPLLIVRQPPHEPYRRVLVPVDFSPWSLPAVATAVRMAPKAQHILLHVVAAPFEAQLRFAGVSEDAIQAHRQAQRSDALAQLRELTTAAQLDPQHTRTVVPDGPGPSNAWMHIIEQEQELACDLIVIGKHGRHALEDLLLGSTTNVVLREGSADLLVSVKSP